MGTKGTADLNSFATMKVCRVCLATGVKMYHMSEHELSVMYERVTGVEIKAEDKLPKMLCWECVASLSTANNFVQKALKTYWILINKIKCSMITMSDIESIDRAEYQLESTLGFKYYNENDFYLHIMETDTKECNIETYTFESELNDFNIKKDPVMDNVEDDVFIPQINRRKEKDPIKIELDVEVEGNAYEDNDDKDDIKFESHAFEISIKEDGSDEEMAFDNVSNFIEALAEEIKPRCESPRVMLEDVMLSEIEHDIKKSLRNLKRNAKSVKKKTQIKASKYKNPKFKKLRVCRTVKNNITYMESEASKELFICDICGKSLQKKNTLIRHICGHTSTYKCSYCTYTTYRSDRLRVHVNSKHTKTVSFDCTYCDYVAYRKTCLTEHINSKHTETFPYHCSQCSYKTCRKSNLTKHINGKHTKTIHFYCTYCNYKTCHKSTLDRHINCTHTKKNVFKCSFCKFEAHRKYILSAHINSKHTKNVSFDCTHCSFKTYRKGNLNAHVKYVHTKNTSIECPFCSYKTCVKSNFRKHIRSVHNNVSIK